MTEYVDLEPKWASSIHPDNLEATKILFQDILDLGGNICGGFPRQLSLEFGLSGTSDIDIFPKSIEARKEILNYLRSKNYILDRTSIFADTFQAHRLKSTSKALGLVPIKAGNTVMTAIDTIRTIFMGETTIHREVMTVASPIQVMKICNPDPYTIIDDFDFTCCQFFMPSIDRIVATADGHEHNTKQIIWPRPECWNDVPYLLHRVLQYVKKGFTLPSIHALRLIALLELEIKDDVKLRALESALGKGGALATVYINKWEENDGMLNGAHIETYAALSERYKARLLELKAKYGSSLYDQDEYDLYSAF